MKIVKTYITLLLLSEPHPICRRYEARPNKSAFLPHLETMKSGKVAAYMWGFVNGKSQTIFPWDSGARNTRQNRHFKGRTFINMYPCFMRRKS